MPLFKILQYLTTSLRGKEQVISTTCQHFSDFCFTPFHSLCSSQTSFLTIPAKYQGHDLSQPLPLWPPLSGMFSWLSTQFTVASPLDLYFNSPSQSLPLASQNCNPFLTLLSFFLLLFSLVHITT